MSKIAIITDSNSGINQAEATKLGIKVVPMPFNIDNKTYFEDITITRKEFFDRLKSGCDISTSQPSPETISELWNETLKEYDEIVHIPMSSALSSSCATAKALAMDYNDKVFVVNNQRISITQRQSVLDAIHLVNMGKSAKEIADILEKNKFQSSIYIMVDTLKYLRKGGRLTPAVAAIGTLLRIKPVLQIQGGKLDTFAKSKNLNNAKEIMINAIKDDIQNRFGGLDNYKKNVHIMVAHTENLENAELFKQEILEVFPDIDIYIGDLSLSVSCHIGTGSLLIACSCVID